MPALHNVKTGGDACGYIGKKRGQECPRSTKPARPSPWKKKAAYENTVQAAFQSA